MRLAFRLIALPVYAAVAMLLAGCEANQLYMGAHTVIGINAQVNPEQTSGWVLVGYDRSFAALVPRSVQKDAQTQDAMAALACSSLWVQGISIKRFNESIATGEAAKSFADGLKIAKAGDDKTRSMKDFFSCFKENPQ